MEGVLFLEKEKMYTEYSKKIKSLFNRAEDLFLKTKEDKILNKKNLDSEIIQIEKEFRNHASIKTLPKERLEIYDHLIPINIADIKIGMTLFSMTIKKNILVTLINARKKEIQIQNGALSIWVSPATLRFPSGTKPKKNQVVINIDRNIRGEIEIDCRGYRLDQFQKTCEQAIDEVVTGEVPFVTIVHGHGDGVLKKWLRDHLKSNHRDLKWENIDGNDGCTKIFF
jgi:DNA mismatch repair protein MutS2